MIDRSLKQTLLTVSALEGLPVNCSKVGKQLGITCPAAKARLQKLVEARAVWLLYPLEIPSGSIPAARTTGTTSTAGAAGAAGKIRKSPKLYLNPSARSLISAMVTPGDSQAKPAAVPSIQFRSRMIRTVCTLESARRRSSTFWYYGGYGKNHVELIVQTPVKRIGFVFLDENRFNRWSWSYCKRVFRQGIIQAAFVLYPGHRIFFVADRLVVLPVEEFCSRYRPWMNACLGSSRKLLLRMVRTYNTTNAGHLP